MLGYEPNAKLFAAFFRFLFLVVFFELTSFWWFFFFCPSVGVTSTTTTSLVLTSWACCLRAVIARAWSCFFLVVVHKFSFCTSTNPCCIFSFCVSLQVIITPCSWESLSVVVVWYNSKQVSVNPWCCMRGFVHSTTLQMLQLTNPGKPFRLCGATFAMSSPSFVEHTRQHMSHAFCPFKAPFGALLLARCELCWFSRTKLADVLFRMRCTLLRFNALVFGACTDGICGCMFPAGTESWSTEHS